MTERTQKQTGRSLEAVLKKHSASGIKRRELGEQRKQEFKGFVDQLLTFEHDAGLKLRSTFKLAEDLEEELSDQTKNTPFYVTLDTGRDNYTVLQDPNDEYLFRSSNIINPEAEKEFKFPVAVLNFCYCARGEQRGKPLLTLTTPRGIKSPLRISVKEYQWSHTKRAIEEEGIILDPTELVLISPNACGKYGYSVFSNRFVSNLFKDLKDKFSVTSGHYDIMKNGLQDWVTYDTQELPAQLGNMEDTEFSAFRTYLGTREKVLAEARQAMGNVGVQIKHGAHTTSLNLKDFLKNGRNIYFGLVEEAIRDYKSE